MIENSLLENNPLWIVDVGAAGGIHSRWKNFTSHFKAILFEPDPAAYEIIKLKDRDNLIFLNSALSDKIKKINFHILRKRELSSVYLPNFDFLNKFYEPERFEVIKKIKIKTDTLDNQLRKNNIAQIDFIKMDTQGHELPILKGSVEILNNVIGLELEVEFVPLYKDQPLFNDVDNFVRKLGFELFDIKRYFWKRNNVNDYGNRKGQLVFGDALYFKSPERILLMNKITQENIIRSICIYLVYGYTDLAQALFNAAKLKGMYSREVHDFLALILSKFKDRNLIPDFSRKLRIQNLLLNIANKFSARGDPYSGTDKMLGNL